MLMQAAPLRAAEPPFRREIGALMIDPPPAVVVMIPVDPRTGRCLAGFTRNPAAACVRHDEPRVVCDAAASGPEACYVAAPSPAPYGLGSNRRLNY